MKSIQVGIKAVLVIKLIIYKYNYIFVSFCIKWSFSFLLWLDQVYRLPVQIFIDIRIENNCLFHIPLFRYETHCHWIYLKSQLGLFICIACIELMINIMIFKALICQKNVEINSHHKLHEKTANMITLLCHG